MDSLVTRNSDAVGERLKNSLEVLRCGLCGKSVSLEMAKADECGRTIHEECYALKLELQRVTTPPAA
jgi:hypothetical protein